MVVDLYKLAAEREFLVRYARGGSRVKNDTESVGIKLVSYRLVLLAEKGYVICKVGVLKIYLLIGIRCLKNRLKSER